MKVGLIGLGMVADTHVAAINDAGMTLIGVVGRNPERADQRAQTFAAQCGYPVPALSLPDLIAAKPDFIILATPPDARQDIVAAVADAGIPIVMEKPIERTLTAAQDIVVRCETAGIPLGIFFQHRARAASLALKQSLNNGILGEIATVDVRVPWWRDQAYYDQPGRGTYARDGGGVLINQAIHTLDLALYLLGPITQVSASLHTTPLHRMEAEDWASASLKFKNGAHGNFMATTADFPGGTECIRIQGTLGRAHLEAGLCKFEFLDGRRETMGAEASTGGGADPMAFTHAWHQSILEDFAQVVKNGGTPICSGRDALGVHKVIDAMERSNRNLEWTEVTP